MPIFSCRFTTSYDIERYEKILARGKKLGPQQQARYDEWMRTDGNPPNNVLGTLMVEEFRRQAVAEREGDKSQCR